MNYQKFKERRLGKTSRDTFSSKFRVQYQWTRSAERTAGPRDQSANSGIRAMKKNI